MALRDKHPDKEIRAAIEYAISQGWTVRKGGGSADCWGILRCPMNSRDCRCGQFCSMSVWGTPKVPVHHAAAIRRTVDGRIALPAPEKLRKPPKLTKPKG